MSASKDIPRPTPPTKLHGLKTSSSRVCCEFVGLAFGSFESIEQPTFPAFCIRESSASSTANLRNVHREIDASRHFRRRSSTRLDRTAVLGCPSLHAPREFQLSEVHVRASIASPRIVRRNSFMTSVPNRTAPNHALQRTAPRVTVAAISSSNPPRPSVALSYVRCLLLRSTPQLPRRAPPSLSLGSLIWLSCWQEENRDSSLLFLQ